MIRRLLPLSVLLAVFGFVLQARELLEQLKRRKGVLREIRLLPDRD